MTKKIEIVMGMPITVVITDNLQPSTINPFEKVFAYFREVDEKYSPFKETSEVAKLNRGEKVSNEMKFILSLSQDLRNLTDGYFDIKRPDGKIDPSGIVKGWAILNAAKILKNLAVKNFYIDAGGDVQTSGKNAEGKKWRLGIRNPFNKKENIKVVCLSGEGIATSGTYERGQHIYDPVGKKNEINDIVSLTVIGPNVFEADKFATPAFAMGKRGIEFIEKMPGLEGYMIDKEGIATMTSGFSKYAID
jgi:thiamine biosynthesis lipoprotein